MSASLKSHYPPDLTSDQFTYLCSNIKDWSILNGLAVRPSSSFVSDDVDSSRSLALTAPVTLFPSLFPKACFQEARAIQLAYNELYASIAQDEDWLKEIVDELVGVDDFIAKLWDVHLAVKQEGYVQHISLGLFRSDYMVHQDTLDPLAKPEIKQVEFNTIASSFGGLASKVSALHSYLLSINAYPSETAPVVSSSSLPQNPSIKSLSLGLATAHVAYGASKSTPALPLCILFVVQTPENNIFDQLALSVDLQTQHKIPTYRLPFSSILTHTTVSQTPDRPLVYQPPHSPSTLHEVSLIYFRAGYSPAEFVTSESWDSRLHLERSAAIKCPSILTHLAGSKKIQQALAAPSSLHLARFLGPDSPFLARIQQTFTKIYPLDATHIGQHAISLATDPSSAVNYVLKPQREGGGNNVYGAKIPHFLKSLGDDERKWRAHILMELIKPPSVRNSILRNGKIQSGEVIGELGIYGVCLWRQGYVISGQGGGNPRGEIMENWEAGWLLRTKGHESEEGGVAAGFGAVDSVCLLDN